MSKIVEQYNSRALVTYKATGKPGTEARKYSLQYLFIMDYTKPDELELDRVLKYKEDCIGNGFWEEITVPPDSIPLCEALLNGLKCQQALLDFNHEDKASALNPALLVRQLNNLDIENLKNLSKRDENE